MTRKIDHNRLGQLRQGQGELVDDVVSDLALALAQAPEPIVVDIPGHREPPWDGADSLRWMFRSSVIGM